MSTLVKYLDFFLCRIEGFCHVFKFHAHYVNKWLLLTTVKLAGGLPDLATTDVCNVSSTLRNYIWRSRWMKSLVTRYKHKKYPLIWYLHVHYETRLLLQVFTAHLFQDEEKLTVLCHGSLPHLCPWLSFKSWVMRVWENFIFALPRLL